MILQRGTRRRGLWIGRNNHSIIRRSTTINRPLLNRRRKKIRRYGIIVLVVRLSLRERVLRRRLPMMRGGALFNHRFETPICERFFEEVNTRNSEKVTRRMGSTKMILLP